MMTRHRRRVHQRCRDVGPHPRLEVVDPRELGTNHLDHRRLDALRPRNKEVHNDANRDIDDNETVDATSICTACSKTSTQSSIRTGENR